MATKSKKTNKVPSQNQEIAVMQGVVTIPLADVIADDEFNARKTYTEIDELAESIRKDGQLQPVLVRAIGDGKWSLVYGFRRYRAMILLAEKGSKIPGFAAPGYIRAQQFSGSEMDAYMVNLSENIARKEVNPFEVAVRCDNLSKKFNLTSTQISARLGKSPSYVRNLVRAMQSLSPELLQLWSEGRIPTDLANKLATKDADEQREEYQRLVGGAGPTNRDGNPKVDRTPRPAAIVGRAKLERAREALRAAVGLHPQWQRGVQVALEFALGQSRAIPGVIDLDEKPKKSKKAKESDE